MDGQLPRISVLLLDGLLEQDESEGGAFTISDHPADNVAAINIDDRVEVEVRPLLRTMQFGNIPRVDLIGSGRAEFGFHVGWPRCLIATVADFTNAAQDSVYRRNRAEIGRAHV